MLSLHHTFSKFLVGGFSTCFINGIITTTPLLLQQFFLHLKPLQYFLNIFHSIQPEFPICSILFNFHIQNNFCNTKTFHIKFIRKQSFDILDDLLVVFIQQHIFNTQDHLYKIITNRLEYTQLPTFLFEIPSPTI